MDPLLLVMMANAVAETIAVRGREHLSDVETNLLEFRPEFKRIVEVHLKPIEKSNGVAHPQRAQLSGD